jgi:DNA-binding SARP family transcriptional activator/streptogramin lyase
MEFRILGPLEAAGAGGQIALGSRKQRALLAILLLRANEVVSYDRLIDDLWGECPPPSAPHTLQVYVSRLRSALRAAGADDGVLVTRPGGYMIRVGFGEFDLHRFEQLVEDSRRAFAAESFDRAADKLRVALALWRGRALADLEFEPFASLEVERLEERRLLAAEDLFEIELRQARHAALIPELEALVDQHPLRERMRGQLMLALYRSGRQADALATFQDGRDYLIEELGLEPSGMLRELQRSILHQDGSLEAPANGNGSSSVTTLAAAALEEQPAPTNRGAIPRQAPVLEPEQTVCGPGALHHLHKLNRKRLVFIGAATVAVLLGAAITITRGAASGGAAVSIRADSIVALDPSGHVLADIPLGSQPTAVSAGPDGVWVATRNQTVRRIDPSSRRITRTIGLGLVPTDLAVGRGELWAASAGYLHRVIRIAIGDGDVHPVTIPVQKGYSGRAGHVLAVGNVVFAADGDHSLFRLRAFEARHLAEVPNGLGLPGGALAVGEGSVWVSDPHSSLLSRVDPQNGRLQGAISLGSPSEARGAPIAVGGGSVWVALAARRTLFQVDPESTSVVRTFRVGSAPSGVAVQANDVWVSDENGRGVTQIDSISGRTKTIDLGFPTVGVAAANQLVWVAVSR